MIKITVLKKTNDDWCPAFKSDIGDLVEVSFMKLRPDSYKVNEWRVCVWGKDDLGLEFDSYDEHEVNQKFTEIINMKFVDFKPLIELGFVAA